jgi:hypothetical protein
MVDGLHVNYGATSTVYRFNGAALKVVDRRGTLRWGPLQGQPYDPEEVYQKEKAMYLRVGQSTVLPNLLGYDDETLSLLLPDVGYSLEYLHNTHGTILKLKDHERRIHEIVDELARLDMFLDDLYYANICFDGHKINVIDFTAQSPEPLDKNKMFQGIAQWFS